DKKAHVVVQVKKNQPKLYGAVSNAFQAVFDAHKEKVVTHIKQEIHGRKEERYVYQLKANLPTELAQKWPTIRSIIAVERHRTIKNKCSID
ncbi:ISAs1 family transposase, partial [Chryseobacterium gambrini]|nr:ISAs1 family transposase [Chryseobacterium gambrini]